VTPKTDAMPARRPALSLRPKVCNASARVGSSEIGEEDEEAVLMDAWHIFDPVLQHSLSSSELLYFRGLRRRARARRLEPRARKPTRITISGLQGENAS